MLIGTMDTCCQMFLGMGAVSVKGLCVMFGISSLLMLGWLCPTLMERYGEIWILKASFFSTFLYYIGFSLVTKENAWLSYPLMFLMAFGMAKGPLSQTLATREV